MAEKGQAPYQQRSKDARISSAEASDDLLLVESWVSPALQQAHCETEIFARLQDLKAQFCEGVEIDKFSY